MTRGRQVSVFLFGPFRVRKGNSFMKLAITGTTQDLLALLIRHAGQVSRRESLSALLWPDSAPEKGRAALNTALWRLKKVLADIPGVRLSTMGDLVTLDHDPDVEVDCTALGAAVEAALLERRAGHEMLGREARLGLARAVSLCNGRFLDGIDSHWTAVERERATRLYERALLILMTDAEATGRIRDALMWGHEILETDPLCEQVHHDMMRLFALTGDRGRAILQFEHLRRLLREELGIDPMPATVSLRNEIVSRSYDGIRRPPGRTHPRQPERGVEPPPLRPTR